MSSPDPGVETGSSSSGLSSLAPPGPQHPYVHPRCNPRASRLLRRHDPMGKRNYASVLMVT